MDLHWRLARMRRWVELGDREGLTNREIARRAGVCLRTVSRWCSIVREQQARESVVRLSEQLDEKPESPIEAAPVADEVSRPERSFIELLRRAPAQASPIQISLSGDRRRVLIDSAVDVEALVRVISAVERC